MAQDGKSNLEEIQNNLNFFSRYPYFRLYTGKEVFRLREKVERYLLQPFASREERQKAHGNFLWLLKKYYSTPFQREAIVLQNFNADSLDLTDKDKLNYLSYILTMKNYTRFSPRFFSILSQYSSESGISAEQSNRVFYKMQTLLAKNYKKDENYQQAALRFYPFLCVYAKNSPVVTSKLLDDYVQMLFKMSSKFPERHVSLLPLTHLMQRMEDRRRRQSEIKSLFGDEFEPEQPAKPQIDKKAVRSVLAQYAAYSLEAEKKGQFDFRLYASMTKMLGYIVEHYDYGAADVRALRKELGGRHGATRQQARLYQMGLFFQRRFNQTQPIPRKKSKQLYPPMTAMDYYFEH